MRSRDEWNSTKHKLHWLNIASSPGTFPMRGNSPLTPPSISLLSPCYPPSIPLISPYIPLGSLYVTTDVMAGVRMLVVWAVVVCVVAWLCEALYYCDRLQACACVNGSLVAVCVCTWVWLRVYVHMFVLFSHPAAVQGRRERQFHPKARAPKASRRARPHERRPTLFWQLAPRRKRASQNIYSGSSTTSTPQASASKASTSARLGWTRSHSRHWSRSSLVIKGT